MLKTQYSLELHHSTQHCPQVDITCAARRFVLTIIYIKFTLTNMNARNISI